MFTYINKLLILKDHTKRRGQAFKYTGDRVYHKLSTIQACQYCQICFNGAIRNEQRPIKSATLKCGPLGPTDVLFPIY